LFDDGGRCHGSVDNRAPAGLLIALPIAGNIKLAVRKQPHLLNAELVHPVELTRHAALGTFNANAGENANFLGGSNSGRKLSSFDCAEGMLDNMRVAYNPRLPLHAAAAMETGRISIFNLL
jgi:hypothetical protein